jgi:hypothetical protein
MGLRRKPRYYPAFCPLVVREYPFTCPSSFSGKTKHKIRESPIVLLIGIFYPRSKLTTEFFIVSESSSCPAHRDDTSIRTKKR